ncbi:MAG: hypothetical protein AAF555_11590 [Verrucomicrobiota bacterium]
MPPDPPQPHRSKRGKQGRFSTSIRQDIEGPNIGKVTRIPARRRTDDPSHEVQKNHRFFPKGTLNSGKKSFDGTRIMGRRSRLFLTMAGLLAGILVLVLLFQAGSDSPAEMTQNAQASRKVEISGSLALDPSLLDRKRIFSFLQKYHDATTVSERFRLIRKQPGLETVFLSGVEQEWAVPRPVELLDPSFEALDSLPFVHGRLVLPNGALSQVALEVVGDQYLLDWESYSGYNAKSLSQFLAEEEALTGTFRVILTPAAYYNFRFADDEIWRCFRMETADGEAGYAYVRRDSALHLRLLNSTQISLEEGLDPTSALETSGTANLIKRTARATLQLRSLGEPDAPDLAEIVGLVGRGWVVP